MVGIKTMDSLPSFRANKALVKIVNLKARKLKTSFVSVVGCFERSWNLLQLTDPDIIDMLKILITCMSNLLVNYSKINACIFYAF